MLASYGQLLIYINNALLRKTSSERVSFWSDNNVHFNKWFVSVNLGEWFHLIEFCLDFKDPFLAAFRVRYPCNIFIFKEFRKCFHLKLQFVSERYNGGIAVLCTQTSVMQFMFHLGRSLLLCGFNLFHSFYQICFFIFCVCYYLSSFQCNIENISLFLEISILKCYVMRSLVISFVFVVWSAFIAAMLSWYFIMNRSQGEGGGGREREWKSMNRRQAEIKLQLSWAHIRIISRLTAVHRRDSFLWRRVVFFFNMTL